MSDVVFDWSRQQRTGVPEAVFCEGKNPAAIAGIVRKAQDRGAALLLTRLDAGLLTLCPDEIAAALDHDPVSRTAILHGPAKVGAGAPPDSLDVGLVCAGTTDIPTLREAERTLDFLGIGSSAYCDLGVAGLWRLLDRIDEIRRHRVLIAVAGMEGALFSVLAGLVSAPLIAVPAPVGYGLSEGGFAALVGAMSTCAPGIACVNIGNGFGAAVLAAKMLAIGRTSTLRCAQS
jgi:pyridinium-3,5-biscarboxylic acid mononucleotide synthase